MIRYKNHLVLEFTVFGNQARKSNSRQKARSGKIIKSKAALGYEKIFESQVQKEWQLRLSVPCRLEAIVYYKNTLSDLSDELLADLCETCDIIIDDNFFREKELSWQFDKKHPRVEVSIFQLEDYPTEWLKKRNLSIEPKKKVPSYLSKAEFRGTMLKRMSSSKGSRTPRMTQEDLDALLTKRGISKGQRNAKS